jgi:hypothetical protein
MHLYKRTTRSIETTVHSMIIGVKAEGLTKLHSGKAPAISKIMEKVQKSCQEQAFNLNQPRRLAREKHYEFTKLKRLTADKH